MKTWMRALIHDETMEGKTSSPKRYLARSTTVGEAVTEVLLGIAP